MHARWKIPAVVILTLVSVAVASAVPFGRTAFRNTWQRTDYPVQQGRATHSWIWGPEPFTDVLNEWYVDSPGGRRAVQYIDKSRMEINDPNADPNSPWYVTNGLLARDMILGQVYVGNLKSIPLGSARVPVAGDPDNTFPTYQDLARVFNVQSQRQLGQHVTQQITPDGFAELPQYAGSAATELIQRENGYGIPRAFWNFMTQSGTVYQSGRFVRTTPLFNWLYVMGYPVTDAYWTRVRVGGVEREVMFQTFERRVLTYTPSNPPQYQVEMGNVGRHYYGWRYLGPFAGGKRALITNPTGFMPSVRSPLLVQGFENGTAFEARITVRLRAGNGEVLAQEATGVERPDIQIPGPFEATLNFTPYPVATSGFLEIVVFSPRDGSEEIIETINVNIPGSGQ